MASSDSRLVDLWYAYGHVTSALHEAAMQGDTETILSLLAEREALKGTIEYLSRRCAISRTETSRILSLLAHIRTLEGEIANAVTHRYEEEKATQSRLKGYGIDDNPRRRFVDLAT